MGTLIMQRFVLVVFTMQAVANHLATLGNDPERERRRNVLQIRSRFGRLRLRISAGRLFASLSWTAKGSTLPRLTSSEPQPPDPLVGLEPH